MNEYEIRIKRLERWRWERPVLHAALKELRDLFSYDKIGDDIGQFNTFMEQLELVIAQELGES